MNIVDSSGWLEFFSDGPNANEFSKPLSDTESLILHFNPVYKLLAEIYCMSSEYHQLKQQEKSEKAGKPTAIYFDS
jgi:toxin FitB